MSNFHIGAILTALIVIFFFNSPCDASMGELGSSVRGKVTDRQNGEKIPGATVKLSGTSKINIAQTDGNGLFVFEKVPPGRYRLIAHSLGYQNDTFDIYIKKDNADLFQKVSLKPEVHQLNEVNIIKKIDKETEASSRMREQNAINVVNVISARTIEVLPDINAAAVLQRVSGVSMERSSSGNASYAIVRGMPPRYNNTLINGVKVPSPNEFSRSVPLDLVSSDIIQRMEVTKALTANMEADAIGGTVNIMMKDAPDSLIISPNIAIGYNQLFFSQDFLTFDYKAVNPKDPATLYGYDYPAKANDFTKANLGFTQKKAMPDFIAGLTIGKRFFRHKLGVILGVNYQDLKKGSRNNLTITTTNQFNTPSPDDYIDRTYSTIQRLLGINFKADYVINSRNHLILSNIYLSMKDIQSRLSIDTSLSNGRTIPGTGYISMDERSRIESSQIESTVLQGNNQLFHNCYLDWSAVYSLALGASPDNASLSTYMTRSWDDLSKEYKNSLVHVKNVDRFWQHNTDQDIAGYLKLNYNPTIGYLPFEFSLGGMYRHKYRINYQNDYNLKPVLDSNQQVPPYTGVDNIQWTPYDAYGNPVYNTSNYNATEDLSGAYLMVKTNLWKWDISGGVRYEVTYTANQHKIVLYPYQMNTRIFYADILPSIHLNLRINEKQNLRFSYYKAISRPDYFEVVDYTIHGDQYDEKGNPNLKHSIGHCFDLRYEFYPGREEVLTAGIFYKLIKDPIEFSLNTNGGQPVYMPGNFGTATNYGFEIVAVRNIYNFSISVNYTFTNSNISTPKIYYIKSTATGNDTTSIKYENRPLQGQSKHIFNASLSYQYPRLGLKCQVSYRLMGRHIVAIDNHYGLDWYQSDYHDLSFSGEIKIFGNFRAFVKLSNLLNSHYKVYTKTGYPLENDYSGQYYLAGLKYKL